MAKKNDVIKINVHNLDVVVVRTQNPVFYVLNFLTISFYCTNVLSLIPDYIYNCRDVSWFINYITGCTYSLYPIFWIW